MQLAIGNDPREAGTPVVNREFTLPELAQRFTRHERRARKFGAYFCAPMAMSQRTGENAQPWQLVALDFDGKEGERPDPEVSKAFFAEVWHVGYSTHSYTPENGKHRVVILLSRAIDAAEYRLLFIALAAVLPFVPDAKLNHPDQPVFFPSCPPGSTPLAWVNDNGQPLDVDAWLSRYKQSSEAESRAERAYRPSGDSVIAAFNNAHEIRKILARHGYRPRGQRYLHPHSQSGIPSVALLRDGALCFSHSSSDPLGDAKPHDAFDVFAILEHGGDKRQAARAAAELLGIANSRDTAPSHPDSSPDQTSEKSTQSAQINTGKASSLHQASTTLHIPEGCFVVVRKDKPPTLMVDSLAARRLAGFLKGHYALNAEAGAWHRFTGTHWNPVHPSVWEEVIHAAMFAGCGEVGFRSRDASDVGTIIRRGNLLPMPQPLPGKLPFQNGLLDLLTRDLEPITPDNAFVWCIPHAYRADGQCPTFLDWIGHATDGDEGKILMLRAYIAAALTGRADLQKFVYLTGPGGSGKSTYMRILTAILGDGNIEATDLKNLEQNRFETARFYGKRLAIITDSDKYGGSVNVLKAMTGQDPLRNERKNVQQGGTFIYDGMVLIAGNECLQVTDYTSGFSRRQLVVEFNRVNTEAEKRNFSQQGGEARLHTEIVGIINWALELDRERVEAIFRHPPEAVARATFDAATIQNPLIGWVTTNLTPKPGHKCYVGDKQEGRTEGERTPFFRDWQWKLYPNYLTWCKSTGCEAVSLSRFSRLLVDLLKNTLHIDVIKHRDARGVY
ncbi:MAG: phage/plasmid primase, P4 family, partial [Methylococcus sp.]